jgi:putative glutamine amidotransferase
MKKPLIGLPGRRKQGRDIAGMPENFARVDIDLYFTDYARGVTEAGGLPVHIPIELDPCEMIPHLDGVLLTGGTDVDPARYGADPSPDLLAPEPERDGLEFALLEAAIERGTPVLGVCRGLQVINVFAGGSLNQHVPAHVRYDRPVDAEEHVVEFAEGSILHGLYGSRRKVNTLHHQTVDQAGDNLVVTAFSDDGVVEGLEHRWAEVLAVQWHPELMTSRAGDPVFRWLVESAAARMAS